MEEKRFNSLVKVIKALVMGEWYEIDIKDEKTCFYKLIGYFESKNTGEDLIILRQLGSSQVKEYMISDLLFCGEFNSLSLKIKEDKEIYKVALLVQFLDELGSLYEFFTYISIEGYASFINKYSDHPRVMGFFQLDVIGDPLKTRENFFKLQKLTQNNPKVFPVWQFGDTLTNLEELVNSEHELIGIGGLVRFMTNRKKQVVKVLDEIFSKFRDTNFHFFGGSNELLLKYPWFSSDSTAHLNARKSANQRKVYLDNGHRIDAPVDMSNTDIIRQNIEFLLGLEKRNCIFQQQEMFLGDHLVG